MKSFHHVFFVVMLVRGKQTNRQTTVYENILSIVGGNEDYGLGGMV